MPDRDHPVTAGPGRPDADRRTVAVAADGRLDRVLAGAMEPLSRSRVKSLIEHGLVSSGGRTITDPAFRARAGQTFDVVVPAPESAVPEAQSLSLDIIHDDDDLIVVNKPPGLVVHPAAGNPDRTLVNALLSHCGERLSGIGGVRRPGIVHRLDKDTSGLMVVAKSDRAHLGLAKQFVDRTLSRTYQAVVWGVPSPGSGEIQGNIGRSPHDRKRMAVVRSGGKTAFTRYRVVRAFGAPASLVECRLLTGRTHQIRVHLASIGHPILGDRLYGRGRPAPARGVPERAREALAGFDRQALHASALRFIHPIRAEVVEFSTDFPNDMKDLIALLESI